MQNRVKQILESKAYTPSRFADHIGVPRATVSHILSGRNKPSLEVVQKILDAFPDMSADWLVKGKGSMGKSAPSLFETMASEEITHKDTGSGIEKNEPGEKLDQKPAKMDKNLQKSGSDTTHDIDIKSTGITQVAHDAKPSAHEKKHKKSVKIIIMYADGTYSEHVPSS